MKQLKTLSLLVCLILSAGGAAIAEEPAGKTPARPPLLDHIRDHGETLMPVAKPDDEPTSEQSGQPADDQSGKSVPAQSGDSGETGVSDGEKSGDVPPMDISKLPPEIRKLLQGRQSLVTEVEPTPALREQLYRQIWQQLANEYVDETKLKDWETRLHKYDGKLNTAEEMDAAIHELVNSVGDRWTKYLSPAEQQEFRGMIKDGYVLSGLLLRRHDDQAWHIDSILYDSAAQKSELKKGDIIRSINGKSLDKLNDHEVIKLTAGHVGEVMKVVAVWDGNEHTVELTLNKPMEDTVIISKLPDDVLYVRLPTFEKPELVDDFINKIKREYFEAKGGLTGIVLDLRNNGGGLFDMALKTSSFFLESGTITKSTVHKAQLETVTDYRVKPMPPFAKKMMSEPHMIDFINWLQNTPMVILINGSTASSSEITAGALQDNGRAYVIGTHSFGKSVGFTIQDLPNGGRFFMTSLKYLTPNGHDVVDVGIQPDQVVEMPRRPTTDLQLVAAHDYVVKLAAKRFKQVQDGRDIAAQPASELQKMGSVSYDVPLIMISVALLGMLIAYVLIARDLGKHNNKK